VILTHVFDADSKETTNAMALVLLAEDIRRNVTMVKGRPSQ